MWQTVAHFTARTVTLASIVTVPKTARYIATMVTRTGMFKQKS